MLKASSSHFFKILMLKIKFKITVLKIIVFLKTLSFEIIIFPFFISHNEPCLGNHSWTPDNHASHSNPNPTPIWQRRRRGRRKGNEYIDNNDNSETGWSVQQNHCNESVVFASGRGLVSFMSPYFFTIVQFFRLSLVLSNKMIVFQQLLKWNRHSS